MTRYPIRLAILTVAALAFAGGLAAMSSAPTQAQEEYTVPVGDFWFGDASSENGVYETTIEAGETVVWNFTTDTAHTTTSDDGLWDSGTMNGGTFDHTFASAGTYDYRCNIHPEQMKGRIIVEAAAQQPTQAPAGNTPAAGNTPSAGSPTPVPGGAPTTGYGPDDGSGGSMSGWWFAGLLAAAGVMLSGAGLFAYRRHR